MPKLDPAKSIVLMTAKLIFIKSRSVMMVRYMETFTLERWSHCVFCMNIVIFDFCSFKLWVIIVNRVMDLMTHFLNPGMDCEGVSMKVATTAAGKGNKHVGGGDEVKALVKNRVAIYCDLANV